jgi:hypothetical protein
MCNDLHNSMYPPTYTTSIIIIIIININIIIISG